MILKEGEILEILTKPRNSNIKEWQKEHAKLDIYVNGGDVSTELEKIRNYENEEQKILREKIAKSTKDVVHNILNPLNKIFNASGGSVSLEDLTDSEAEKVNNAIEQLPEGMSLREWMETYWKDAFVVDPNGVILIEIDEEGNTYPTYKNISKVYDYTLTWDRFDYLVLLDRKVEIEKEQIQIYRVIDDAFDALFYVKNKQLFKYGVEEGEEGEQHAVINTIQEVPAIVCGGIIDKVTGGKLPFINKIDESLKEYLRASSVHTIYKFLHLFPKFWSYAMKCSTCSGTGQITDKQTGEKKKCPTCNGARLKKVTDVSDGIYLPLPKDGQPVIGSNIAGYIDTPIQAWDQQNQDLNDMRQNMEYTLWGSYLSENISDREKTATEAFINVQPINENLCAISRFAENKETTIISYMTKILLQKEEVDVNVMYGKRFVIESPDALWNKYLEAKEKQAPITTLDYHYEQYLMSEYQNDLSMLQIKKAIFSIEPFPHYSIETIKDVATQEQLQKKILFSEWITGADLTMNPDNLRSEFETYTSTYTQKQQTKTEE